MKPMKFIRSGPHLPVKNLAETITYYRNKLGFYDEWTWTNKEGNVADGGIRRNEMRLLFAENPEFTTAVNNNDHRLPLMWFVENIEEIYSEFKSKGIEIIDDISEHAYGLKEFAFIDINGYYIRVAEGFAE